MADSHFGRNSILYFLSMMLPKCVSLIMLSIYSFYISPQDYGIYSYTTNITSFMAVLSCLGLNIFYLRSYGEYKDKKVLNGSIYWVLSIWNIILLFAGTLISYLIWPHLQMSFDYWPYIPCALTVQFFSSFEIIPTRTYRLKGEVKYYFLRIFIKTLLNSACCFYFLKFKNMGIMSRYMADLIIGAIFALVFINYMCKESKFFIDIGLIKRALIFGLPLVPAEFLEQITPLVNSVMIERLLGLESLGIYTMGLSLASVVSMLTTSITFTFEPEFYLKSKSDDFARYSNKLKQMQMVICAIFCTAAALFVKEAVAIVLSSKYQNAWEVTQMLAVTYFINVLYYYIYQHAIVQEKTKSVVWASLFRIAAIILFSYMLYPGLKIYALGIVNILCILTEFITLYYLIDRKKLGQPSFYKDFCAIFLTILVVIGTRKISCHIIIALIIKSAALAGYTMVILKLYHLKMSEVYSKIKKGIFKK